MITLERIVESLKIQLKPHINDDVVLLDSWLIDIINQSRAALLRKIYVSGESLTPFYQEITCLSVDNTVADNSVIKLVCQSIVLPEMILGSSGKKNIQYVGTADYSMTDIHYVELEEFIAYQHHRFGNSQPAYTNISNRILIRNAGVQTKWLIRAIFASPDKVSGYVFETSVYPIDNANLRQLEIITFQHIAQKLGMPVDIMNIGQDETKNAPVMKGQQQDQQQDDQQQ